MTAPPADAPAPTPGRTAPGVEERARLLKAIADPTRLAVLDMLSYCGTHCHGDLEDLLDVPTSRLSFHLKVLRDAGLVESQREGKRVRYRLMDGAFDRICRAVPMPANSEDGRGPPRVASGVSDGAAAR